MEKEIKVSRVTTSYGFSIYPDVRKKQQELSTYYKKSMTKVVTELIEEEWDRLFGDDNEK